MTTHRSEFFRSTSGRVVAAVAERKGAEPSELEPLYRTLDPDSLDDLFTEDGDAPDQGVDHLTFDYAGYRVTVSRDGTVDLAPSPDRAVPGQ